MRGCVEIGRKTGDCSRLRRCTGRSASGNAISYLQRRVLHSGEGASGCGGIWLRRARHFPQRSDGTLDGHVAAWVCLAHGILKACPVRVKRLVRGAKLCEAGGSGRVLTILGLMRERAQACGSSGLLRSNRGDDKQGKQHGQQQGKRTVQHSGAFNSLGAGADQFQSGQSVSACCSRTSYSRQSLE